MNTRALGIGLLAAVVPAVAVAQQHLFVGRVLGENGDAVAGAAVTARWCAAPELPGLAGWTLGPAGDLGSRSAAVRTDASGRFRFELPVPGPVSLVARDATGTRQSLRCFPVMAGGATDVRLRAADFVAGVVLGVDRQPLPGLELVLEPEAAAWACRALAAMPLTREKFATDASGRFRHALEHAWLRTTTHEPSVLLLPADQALGFAREHAVLPLPETAQLQLGVASRPLVRGVLRDLAGKAVAGGRVYEERAPWRLVRTDGNGAFASPARIRSQLVVAAEGLSAQLGMQSGRRSANLDVTLVPSRRIAVRLLDEGGAPLADRDVLWSTARRDEPPEERHTRTDAEGRTTFDDAPVLTTGCGFVLVDGVWRRFIRLRISRDEDLGDHTVTWRALDGQVTDDQGVPCAGLRVVACESDQIGPLPPCWVTYTNHGGRFRFPSLPRRGFTVLVDAGVNGLARAAVAADERTCAVQLVAGRTFEVAVEDAEGGPAAGAWVSLYDSGGAAALEAPSPTMLQTSLVGVADERGCVRFRGLPERDWTVLAHRLHGGTLASYRSTEPLPEDSVTVRLRPAVR